MMTVYDSFHNFSNGRSVYCGIKSISFLGLKMWNIVLNKFKKETPLNAFKKPNKKCQPELSVQAM